MMIQRRNTINKNMKNRITITIIKLLKEIFLFKKKSKERNNEKYLIGYLTIKEKEKVG